MWGGSGGVGEVHWPGGGGGPPVVGPAARWPAVFRPPPLAAHTRSTDCLSGTPPIRTSTATRSQTAHLVSNTATTTVSFVWRLYAILSL